MDLTPKQLHYFKRELITLELEKEIATLISSPDISSLLSQDQQEMTDFPFLRYIFHNVIIEFPLLKHTCDDEFWPKCKLFLNEFNKVQLDSFYAPRHTQQSLQRRMIKHKIQKSLVFAFCASIKTFQGQEESIKVDMTTSPPISPLLTKKQEKLKVNIVTVREEVEKRTLRQVSHAAFLIEAWYPNQLEPVYVARRHGEFRKFREQLKHHFKSMNIPLVPAKVVQQEQLFREQDRLVLRGWLNQILENSTIAKSAILKKFLTHHPIMFTIEEEQDTLKREEADKNRYLEQEKFQKELDRRVMEMNSTLDDLKKEIIQPGGLIKVFDSIKEHHYLTDLPESLLKAFEWGRVNFAFALHRQFLTSDTAAENLNNLKRTHGLMPYRTMSIILRLSNPMSMVKSIMDLFLAQPFGGRSLFQRMLISNMHEESKAFNKEIERLEKKIDDQVICKKVYNAIRTPLPPKTDFRDYKSGTLELLSLLGNDEIEPVLSADQITMIADSSKSQKLIKHSLQLWELYERQREQELMMNLVFQGVTGELLKEFIAVFYQPLAQVYKAADISTTIRHVQSFLEDLIQVIQTALETEEQDASETIQVFIDLVARHEQQFYEFVHNVHSQEASQVFDELIQYVDKLFTFVAQGIPGKIDILHAVERAGYTDHLDALQAEIDAICEYRYKQKLYHFERQRRKPALQSKDGLMNMAEIMEKERNHELFQYLPKRAEMMGVLQDFDELEFDDQDDFEDEEFSSSNNSNSSGSSSRSSIPSRRSSGSSGSHVSHVGFEKPTLHLIPKLVPFFVNDVVHLMNQ